MKISFCTLGCKANQYDTQAMVSVCRKAGHDIVPFGEKADACVINSCTVTAESDRKARQLIGRATAVSPDGIVLVCGCYAQRDDESVLAMDGVDAVMGTDRRGDIARILEQAVKGGKLNAVSGYAPGCEYEEISSVGQPRIRAHIKVQDGCDRYCTYCIIPYTRGPIRSRSLEGIRADAAAAGRAGCREVVLTGIRIASFGRESGGTLMDAVEAVAETDVYRIRLGSLDPDELDESFVRRAADCEKLCRHFHLSLQSGSDTVLKRMGRRYTTAQYTAIMNMIKGYMPDASFTTDIMTGFVGETEEEFRQGMEYIRLAGFGRIHVFPYSVREGTAAARMDGHLPKAEKQRRAAILSELADGLEVAFAESMVGKRLEIIPEPGHGMMEGYARNYARVAIPEDEQLEGRLVYARITHADGRIAIGRVE